MNKYEARKNNAVRIAEKINALLDEGYNVFDENGEQITGRFTIEDGDVYLHDDSCNVIYFIYNLEFDHGIYMTIPEYNKYFEDWTYVHPKHVKKLFPKRKGTECTKR